MDHVPYHNYDAKIIAQYAERRAASMVKLRESMRNSGYASFTLYNRAKCAAFMGWATDRDASRLAEHLRVMMIAGLAVAEGAQDPFGTIQHDMFAEGPVEVPSQVERDVFEQDLWFDTFYAALLLRDAGVLRRICAASRDLDGVPSTLEYKSIMDRAWRAYGDTGGFDRVVLNQAMLATDAAKVPDDQQGEAWAIHAPDIGLADLIAQNDSARANKLIADWAPRRQRYFEDERSLKPEGFLALGQSALCAVAVDQGMTIDIDCDDMPNELIFSG